MEPVNNWLKVLQADQRLIKDLKPEFSVLGYTAIPEEETLLGPGLSLWEWAEESSAWLSSLFPDLAPLYPILA